MKNIFFVLGLICPLFSFSQETFPVNGPKDKSVIYYAFTNAKIVVSPLVTIEKATLLINEDKIIQVGVNVVVPPGTVVLDLKGKSIYPSFIDAYSNYGMPEIKKGKSSNGTGLNRKGPIGWNEAVKPEIDASTVFQKDAKVAEELRKIGFGTVYSQVNDGIMRGTGMAVTLSDEKDQIVVLNPKIASYYSFEKGSSSQEYPSSLMGAIALLRQTLYDAQWYKSNRKETNLSLDAINKNILLPQVFESPSILSLLRADKIGDEFKMQYIIKGAGNEYQRLKELKETNANLILPLNFPATLNVEDPFEASQVQLDELKHWEAAPFNPYFVFKSGIKFCLTTDKLKEKKDFFPNLIKAVANGLPQAEALAALTTNPATWFKLNDKVGELKPGMLANFIITSGDVFEKKTKIFENWIQGKQHIINPINIIDANGNYTVELNAKNSILTIEGDNEKPKATIKVDTTKISVDVTASMQNWTLSFTIKDKGVYRAALTFDEKSNLMYGALVEPTGKSQNVTWKRELVVPIAKEDSKDSTITTPIVVPTISYPNMAYGFNELPKQDVVLIKNATIWTNESEGILKNSSVLISNGKVQMVGATLIAPPNAIIIDGTGKHVTAGIIDEHSHIAISGNVNEGTQEVSAEVRIGDVINSDDINMYRQLSGGVTAAQLLHGSANPIGGQSALIKLRWGLTPEQMKIMTADGFIKCALGENVKQSNWGENYSSRYPQTRMGVEQVFIDAFTRAKEYDSKLKTAPLTTRRDLELDALSEIVNKKRFITSHSYVQSEINMLMHVADSFKFKINTFTHILEGYKVADKMKKHGVFASTFSDWWSYKYEVMEAIPYNAAILTKMGITTAINSDDAEMARRLNQEAAKSVKYGNLSEEEALKMVTLNPAKMLHLDNRMGSIKAGKDADLVIWSDNPLSIYAKAEKTFIEGICYFDLKRDFQMREEIVKEKERIIQKMLLAKKNGEKSDDIKPKKRRLNDCEYLNKDFEYESE